MVEQITTEEKVLSKTHEEIIREAKRIEEDALYSSKGHYSASYFWTNFHLWIGIPIVILAAIAGASSMAKFDPNNIIAGIIAIAIAALSSVMTFLNPNQKSSIHLNAGNRYNSLQNRARMFWSIDCWQEESDAVLISRLKEISIQKDNLNQNSPQIPQWAYKSAKKGIASGEAGHLIDNK